MFVGNEGDNAGGFSISFQAENPGKFFVRKSQDWSSIKFWTLFYCVSDCFQDVIDRIRDLQEGGRLSGVLDDRGKFIYITMDEYEAVAKFIKQRGRVSISDLAESSNKLINLTPDNDQLHAQLVQ